ncbi:phosphoadenosine phosphosulfate reductase [Pacificimonas flava]|uniref:Adenosine 5'-phosphosulfate reductase n=2 Tax=Pacificimonas TaxID=1960290 RepID=A0A219B6T8_9SPHN|nr:MULTISPECIES: phosphoadenylyl-sulfate reductase [Pacificimonas]MBZ6379292.1 phosphoadenylyl-sulfate reductase [Pacificimonas aurantium]OWV33498.1 phosphoadenosine phosphosulfate reductase [Pacificimonas flava]
MASQPGRVPDRDPDRLDLGYTNEDAMKLNREFRGSDAAEFLDAMLHDRFAGELAMVSSFGTESAALLHLVAQVDPATPVIFLETGKHFPETLAYRDTLVERLGLTDVRNIEPDPADLAAKDEKGLRWSYDPDGCCDIRKVKPLARALSGFSGSVTGRKAFQANTRTLLPRVEADLDGRLKINPIIDWQKADIDAYFDAHDLPRHPLEKEGYPSIGCAPCTSKVQPGEDPRSGRWRGWDKTECGIHTPLKPGEQPSF